MLRKPCLLAHKSDQSASVDRACGQTIRSARSRAASHERIRAMRKAVETSVGLGILAGIAYAGWRAWKRGCRTRPTASSGRPRRSRSRRCRAPRRETSGDRAGADADAGRPHWAEPKPTTAAARRRIRSRASSRAASIHVPGGANYERTHADRCYVDADAAAADGLRQSQGAERRASAEVDRAGRLHAGAAR